MQKTLVWYCPIQLKNDGYGYAFLNLFSRVDKSRFNVVNSKDVADPSAGPKVSGVHISLEDGFVTTDESFIYLPDEAWQESDILINNCLPEFYRHIAAYKIGFTYWETETLPRNWINNMLEMDELWTTSSWAEEVFKHSTGHKNVHSFKLGIDPLFNKFEGTPEGPFTFMHMGSPSTRKNTQMAVDAFLKLFRGNSDYHLIIKSIGAPDARLKDSDGSLLGSIYNHPQITVIDRIVNESYLSRLYEKAHCFIYPTSGEGWGMMPFQSIAKGVPTICTDYSACKEYAYLSIPLDYKLGDTNKYGIYADTQWAIPDFDDLCDKMLYVASNYHKEKEKVLKGSDYIHSNMTWDMVIKDYNNRLCQI